MRLNVPRVYRPQILRPATATPSARRAYAFQASGGAVFKVFNSRTKWLQKERAAANPELSRQADYLKDEVAMRVCERLLVSLLLAQLTSPRSRLTETRTSNANSPASSTSAQTHATSPAP
jgi:hypothetical protein